eukprot:15304445-Ditylum_brightwellii.AAC.1
MEKRYRSTIRRMREERSGRDWDGDDDDDRNIDQGKRQGDKIQRNELSKYKRDFITSHNAKKQYGELIETLIVPKRFEKLLKEKESQGQKEMRKERLQGGG